MASTSIATPKVTTNSAPSPQDVVKKLLSNVYTLYYRKGNNPHPQVKNFYSHGKNIQEHVEIAKSHCLEVGARFVRLEKFISDLKEDERKAKGIDDNLMNGDV